MSKRTETKTGYKPFPVGNVRGPFTCGWGSNATGGVSFMAQGTGGWVPFTGERKDEASVEKRARDYARENTPSIYERLKAAGVELASHCSDPYAKCCPAAKEIIFPGKRGDKNKRQDLIEARQAIDREIEMMDEDENRMKRENGIR